MNHGCKKWSKQLLEAALGGSVLHGLEDHLRQCQACADELTALRKRRERLEALLPLLARAEEPSPDLRARILEAAARASHRPVQPSWRRWALAGASAGIFIAMLGGWFHHRRGKVVEADLRGAEALAQWRSPTGVLLDVPGRAFLQTTPTLGESYISVSSQEGKRRHSSEKENH